MEIFRLNANKFLISCQKSIANGIYNSGFAGVVATDKSCHARAKGNLQLGGAVTKLTKIADSEL